MLKSVEQLRHIAEKVMDNALPIQKDEVAIFLAGIENLDLAYAFAAECEVRGIETMIRSQGDYISRTKLLQAPLETLAKTPLIPKALVEVADWLIWMKGSLYDNSIYQKKEFKKRLLEAQRVSKWSVDNLLQLCLEKKTHFLAFLDPNLQQAQALGMAYDKAREMFLASLDIDYDKLTNLGEKIVGVMEGGGEIRLTSRNGTNLRLHAGGRFWINDDGKPLPQSTPVTQYVHNLPVGEVFVAPIEETAHGVVYPKSLPGSPLRNVKIEFKREGKAVFSAKEGYELIKPRLERATGNPYSIAEFAIGTNPCGNMLLATEKAYGSCHVAIGQNTWLGGKNECSIHWDFLIEDPTVTIDEKPIIKNGEFMV